MDDWELLSADARAKLAEIVEDELDGSRVRIISVSIDDDGNIGIDEIYFRTRDGEDFALGRGSNSPIPVSIDDVKRGWRPFTVRDDYPNTIRHLAASQRNNLDRPEDQI